MPKFIDLTGQRFGRLVAIKRAADIKPGVPRFLCQCDCGNKTIVRASCLKKGTTKSCKCIHKEMLVRRLTTHGMTYSREYNTWQALKKRCNNSKDPFYKDYGGRGIKVCDRWNSFENFFTDMGTFPTPKHEIDRIDNNRNYEPSNCRWATRTEQANNTRHNVIIEYQGQSKNMKQWSNHFKIPYQKLKARITLLHWSPERAFTTP